MGKECSFGEKNKDSCIASTDDVPRVHCFFSFISHSSPYRWRTRALCLGEFRFLRPVESRIWSTEQWPSCHIISALSFSAIWPRASQGMSTSIRLVLGHAVYHTWTLVIFMYTHYKALLCGRTQRTVIFQETWVSVSELDEYALECLFLWNS